MTHALANGHCPTCGSALIGRPSVAVDIDTGMLSVGGKSVYLPHNQAILLHALVSAMPRMVSKGHLMDVLYGQMAEEPGQKILSVFICLIRRAIAGMGLQVQTHWGLGYSVRIHSPFVHADVISRKPITSAVSYAAMAKR